MCRKLLTFLAVLIILPAAVLAAIPAPKGFVNDFANVLSADTKSKLEGMLSAFEKSTTNEIAVVTVPSLDGEPVENVAVSLFKKWGIGKKGKDNGVLFLVAPNERKMRIEVGYGLEGAINDALAGRIMDEAVIPRFKTGDMDSGIASGAMTIVKVISAKEGLGFDADTAYGAGAAMLAPMIKEKKSGPLGIIAKIIIFLVMAYLFIRHPWLFLIFLSGMGRGGGGGRGFSGGFGGFGGGLSGGGGASRGW
ncbi:MAG: TPM domain-containing protein [Pseudomonadota bacterium]